MMEEILKMSVAERILLVEAIWATIPNEEDAAPLSDETKTLLDQRLASHEADPNRGAPWEEVKARIQTK